MIKPSDIIKHKNFLDVAILVLDLSENPETNEIEIQGIYINQGQKTSYVINSRKYPIGIPAVLKLKRKDLQDWLVCSKPKASFIRNEDWKELK